MKQDIVIPLEHGINLYGTLQGDLDKSLAIFVHGFTGHKDEHIFFNGSRYLHGKGISSFRFNLYDWRKDARKLENTPLSLSAKDLDIVIRYFRNKGVKKIFVIGHSFGGVTVLLSQEKDFDAMVLWEASDKPAEVTKSEYIVELDKYYVTKETAYGFTIGKEMIEENKTLDPFNLINEIKKPTFIVVAGNGTLIEGGRKYLELADEPKEFVIIDGATHNFNEGETSHQLFEKTYNWLKAFV